jgi:hypothetical protein
MLYHFDQSFLLLIMLAETYAGFAQDDADEVTYGLDVSFPIHNQVSTDNPLGDRHQMYINHLDGCRKHYSPSPGDINNCDEFEYDRIIMNRRQPQSMVNLTATGFTKIRSPPNLKKLIDEFWKDNKDKAKIEAWHSGNSYVNHWDSPTTLVSVDDKGLRGSGDRLKEHIWAAASAVLEEWTQVELQPCSLYGIRVYHEGAIMMPHVDRLPLVASAVINVAQDVEEDWPTVSEIDIGSSNRAEYKRSQNIARRLRRRFMIIKEMPTTFPCNQEKCCFLKVTLLSMVRNCFASDSIYGRVLMNSLRNRTSLSTQGQFLCFHFHSF